MGASLSPIRPSSAWASLGTGPFAIRVLTGTIVLQQADKRPATDDGTGALVTAAIGGQRVQLAAGEWWVKAIVTETIISLQILETTGSGSSDTATTGTLQTLSASDVGAYSMAQADTASFLKALIYG